MDTPDFSRRLKAGGSSDSVNQAVYRSCAPVYHRLSGALMQKARRRSVELLALQPGERLLLPGIGTGLDIPNIPVEVRISGTDTSPEMLSIAREKACEGAELALIDAQDLRYPDSYFDAIVHNLILSVAPDGKKVCEEAWRVLRPGGRLVIFDKFLPGRSRMTSSRRTPGWIASRLAKAPNRRLLEILSGLSCVQYGATEQGLLHGQHRIVLLVKHCA